jgi:aldehyde dehydrogenase (NAD+)
MKSTESLVRCDHYIDGARVAPAGGEYLATENPYTGKTWGSIARGNRADAEAAVEAAQRAFVPAPAKPDTIGARLLLAAQTW